MQDVCSTLHRGKVAHAGSGCRTCVTGSRLPAGTIHSWTSLRATDEEVFLGIVNDVRSLTYTDIPSRQGQLRRRRLPFHGTLCHCSCIRKGSSLQNLADQELQYDTQRCSRNKSAWHRDEIPMKSHQTPPRTHGRCQRGAIVPGNSRKCSPEGRGDAKHISRLRLTYTKRG